jgi:hypothetical protein
MILQGFTLQDERNLQNKYTITNHTTTLGTGLSGFFRID